MTNALVECIPNFSEARRPEVVEEIVQAISAVAGVAILDRHSDLDHNRTVITLAGSPEAVEEAAFQSIRTAAALIDLDQHTGQHPRLGAADVVPFVPIRDIGMAECVELARRVGKRVGEELQLPVYLYEEAATRPERKNLEDVRRGEYEALKEEIGKDARRPDFGPARVGPAGAVIIGARQPLIAFNVYLASNDVTIAQKIARAIRYSSGGLRYVKALGLLVDGRAQVSMNLTNFRQTPIARVVEMVRREAARYGVGVQSSELVGLIPQEALIDAATWHLQLDHLEAGQILEQRLNERLSRETDEPAALAEDRFLDALAAGTAAPGGGSAAAHTGAAAAALVAMVARLTVGKKKYAEVSTRMLEITEEAEGLRSALSQAVEEDAAAFTQYMTAARLPKDTAEQQLARAQELQTATLATIHAPMHVMELALRVHRLALEAAQTGNLNAISDAAVGGTLARAALSGAFYNVQINLPNLEDETRRSAFLTQASQWNAEDLALDNELQATLRSRANLAGITQ